MKRTTRQYRMLVPDLSLKLLEVTLYKGYRHNGDHDTINCSLELLKSVESKNQP